MNIEQLQAMTDAELNELAAVKVMRYKVINEGTYSRFKKKPFDGYYITWNPTTDMNDAMVLMDKIKVEHDHIGLFYSNCMAIPFWTFQITDLIVHTNGEMPDTKEISVDAETASRAITIAAILAKGSEQDER